MSTPQRRLGVNIDHIATLRQARRIHYPDPVDSLPILVKNKVHQVTIHLREDRRHIQDHDLDRAIKSRLLPVNLEMALTDEMISIALLQNPSIVTLVPEKREEITTEGGLDLTKNQKQLKKDVSRLMEKGIRVSLFIDPDLQQTDLAVESGAEAVEFHTGSYCEAFGTTEEKEQFTRLEKACAYAARKGLKVYAGHGLNIENLPSVTRICEIEEYNIGHSIIARAVFIGLDAAIREVQEILQKP